MKKAVGTGPKMHSEDKMGPVPSIGVYTTRIDTVFGMTYAVLAPDHESVNDFITPEQKDACLKYIDNASKKSDQDRTQDDKEKT
jgi:leucyl-tRNA synthetase